MRSRTIIGLAFAGAAVAATAVAGVAYAADDPGPVVVRIIQDDQGSASYGSYDCPDQDGSGSQAPSDGPSAEGAL